MSSFMHLIFQEYGEVDADFPCEFENELGRFWLLVDVNGNKHRMRYVKSETTPIITTGWTELRLFFGLSGNHSAWMRYV